MTHIERKIDYDRRLLCFVILLIAAALTLPFIGMGHFYTRGEPREALVALAMIEQGNFVLPVFQGEFAFKPPMLHWLVSLFSLPQGYVSEYTARMPSALAFIAMSVGFFSFYARRYDVRKVFVATLIMMTTFEVHRAAMTCRVDMVLTAFMVGGFLALYSWYERGFKGVPVVASLLISGAILTKGPIGAILPCFALTVFLLIHRIKWTTILRALLIISVMSSILPLCWYVAAYNVGGDRFLQLVLEENFGRFMGKMTYESHENGIFYYFPILAAGLVPWSVLLLLGLFTIKKKSLTKEALVGAWKKFRTMPAARQWAVVVTVCVFVFYCIPKSKRSVYLLPLYPFISLLIADFLVYMVREHRKLFKGYAVFVVSVGFLFSILLLLVPALDLNFLGDSRSSRRLIMQLGELQHMAYGPYYIVMALLPALVGVAAVVMRKKEGVMVTLAFTVWIAALLSLDGLLNPAIKNSVPDFQFAKSALVYQPDGAAYFYRPASEKEETLYTVAFYMDDKLLSYTEGDVLPEHGYIILREANKERFETHMADKFNIAQLLTTETEFTSFRGNLLLYEFRAK